MASIDFRKESARQLDKEKRALEARIASSLRSVFRNLANDAENLYKANETLDANDLATNYYPDFLVEVRSALRKAVKEFGFSLRDTINKKHFIDFDIEYKKKLLDYELKQTVEITDTNLNEQVEEINNEFNREATLFIANESESQTEFITQTNEKEINKAVAFGLAAYLALLTGKQDDIQKEAAKLANATEREARRIQRNIDRLNREIERLQENRAAEVAAGLKRKMIDDSKARSDLIAAQTVGMGESWSRETEAEIINNQGLLVGVRPLQVIKEWVGILDSRIRPDHFAADGQRVPVNDSFFVGGENMKAPRLGSIPANNINCRCVVNYSTEVS